MRQSSWLWHRDPSKPVKVVFRLESCELFNQMSALEVKWTLATQDVPCRIRATGILSLPLATVVTAELAQDADESVSIAYT